MKAYKTVQEMAEAYAKEYNQSYGMDTVKHFTVEDVMSVNVYKLARGFAGALHIDASKWSQNWTYAINGFGYVEA